MRECLAVLYSQGDIDSRNFDENGLRRNSSADARLAPGWNKMVKNQPGTAWNVLLRLNRVFSKTAAAFSPTIAEGVQPNNCRSRPCTISQQILGV